MGNASTDLVMITAKVCGQSVSEVVAPKTEREGDLISRLNLMGLPLTYPVLETEQGDLITESPAICKFLALTANRNDLLGLSPSE